MEWLLKAIVWGICFGLAFGIGNVVARYFIDKKQNKKQGDMISMANKRFEVKETQGVLNTGKIIVDTQKLE